MIHLSRSPGSPAGADALAATAGGRTGLSGLVDTLVRAEEPAVRRARGSRVPRLLGRAVDWAFTWDADDRRDRRWWPQGITSSADGDAPKSDRGRDLLVTSWYSKKPDGVSHGSRVSVIDLATLRYAHVLLVVASVVGGRLRLEPLRVHAGGLVWHGPWLHVAATGRGFLTCHWDDLVQVADGDALFGHTHLLPVRFTHRGAGNDGVDRLRFSFLSLDRSGDVPRLVAGEYGRGRQTRRVARFALDPGSGLPSRNAEGRSTALHLDDFGLARMQGVVLARGRWYATASVGPWLPGSVHVGDAGRLRAHHLAAPIGPEDLTWWPAQDRLWTVTEHPRRRWVCAMRRDWFA